MTLPIIPAGNFVLPVCIQDANEVSELLSALDLYRVMRKKGESYGAFNAVLDSLDYADNPQDSPCLDIGTDSNTCWTIETTNSAMQFFYNDPFVPIEEQTVPRLGQWTRWQDERNRVSGWVERLAELADDYTAFDADIGYYPNDCFVRQPDNVYEWGDPSQFLNSLDAIRKLEFPYVRIECSGSGQLELELLKLPFGGSAIILYDFELSIWDILWQLVQGNFDPLQNVIQTELEREMLTFPPEVNESNVIEINFEDDTDHVVECYFVPRFDYSALDFLGQGGGIRSVSMCQNLTLKSPDGETIKRTNHRLDQFTREGFIMATQEDICAGMMCAMEKIAQRILLASDVSNIENSIQINKDTLDVTIEKPLLNSDQLLTAGNRDIVNGQSYQIASGIQERIEQIRSWFNDDGLTQQEIETRAENLYGLSNVALVSDIITSAGNPFNLDVALLTEYLYEESNDIVALAQYAYTEADAVARDALLAMQSMLTDAIITTFERKGALQPRDDWRDYSSTLIAPFERVFDASELIQPAWQTGLLKMPSSSRMVRFEVSGLVTDGSGNSWDGLYFKDSNDDLTAERMVLRTHDFVSRDYAVPNAPPSYQSDGGYQYNMTSNHAGNGTQSILFPVAVTDITTWSGSITVKIFDLGEI